MRLTVKNKNNGEVICYPKYIHCNNDEIILLFYDLGMFNAAKTMFRNNDNFLITKPSQDLEIVIQNRKDLELFIE